jgi:hypothetical protein
LNNAGTGTRAWKGRRRTRRYLDSSVKNNCTV